MNEFILSPSFEQIMTLNANHYHSEIELKSFAMDNIHRLNNKINITDTKALNK